MSWLFSRALVAEYSEESCLDGAQFALWSGTSTPQPFSPNDKTMGFWKLSRYGMTYKPLTDDHGEALLTSYLEASRAKTSASQAEVRELTATAVECGNTWHELSVRYDRDMSLWKTHRSLFDEVLHESLVILPQWGMMRDGVLLERTMQAHHIIEREYGLFLTPTANEDAAGKSGSKMQKMLGNDPRVRGEGGGTLNPNWVEWLMGWPIGWTDLKPLATDKFQQWLLSHGAS